MTTMTQAVALQELERIRKAADEYARLTGDHLAAARLRRVVADLENELRTPRKAVMANG